MGDTVPQLLVSYVIPILIKGEDFAKHIGLSPQLYLEIPLLPAFPGRVIMKTNSYRNSYQIASAIISYTLYDLWRLCELAL